MPQPEPPQLPDWPISRSDAIARAEFHARNAERPPRWPGDVADNAARSVAWSTLAIALGQDAGEL